MAGNGLQCGLSGRRASRIGDTVNVSLMGNHLCRQRGAGTWEIPPDLSRKIYIAGCRAGIRLMKNLNKKWIVEIIVLSFGISVAFSLVSSRVLAGAGYVTAIIVLAVFVAIGIIFDMVGVAITSAVPAPFHSMASHRERGAKEALRLLKNAEKVASVCNDVVGDIAGIISGTTSAVLAGQLIADFNVSNVIAPLIVSGVVASVTIGGKAVGKVFGMKRSTEIVLRVGKLLSVFNGKKKKR